MHFYPFSVLTLVIEKNFLNPQIVPSLSSWSYFKLAALLFHFFINIFLFFKYIYFYFGCTGFSCVMQLSCPVACGVLVPQPGLEPTSPTLDGRFFTTG